MMKRDTQLDLNMTASPSSGASAFASVRPDWLSLAQEAAIETDIPILDCHHHSAALTTYPRESVPLEAWVKPSM